MERETRQLSLLSLDSQARIRLTTRQSSSVFSRLRSTGENIRTTFEHSSLTIQSYHRREDPFDIQARHKYSPLIINLNDHRLHSRENGNSPSTSNFLPAKLVKGWKITTNNRLETEICRNFNFGLSISTLEKHRVLPNYLYKTISHTQRTTPDSLSLLRPLIPQHTMSFVWETLRVS